MTYEDALRKARQELTLESKKENASCPLSSVSPTKVSKSNSRKVSRRETALIEGTSPCNGTLNPDNAFPSTSHDKSVSCLAGPNDNSAKCPAASNEKSVKCPAAFKEKSVKQSVSVSKHVADKLKKRARAVVMKKELESKHTDSLVNNITEKVMNKINDKVQESLFNARQKKVEISLWHKIETEKKENNDKATESGKTLDVNLMSDEDASIVFIAELLDRFAYAKAFDQGSFLVNELVVLVNTIYNTEVSVPTVLPRQWSLPLQVLGINV
jgi:hypothetical protein